MSDSSVLIKIKEGDIKVFEKVFKNFYSPLCFYSTSIVGDLNVAEEIVQDLFYVLWRDKERLEIKSLKEYLFGAIRNKSLQHLEHMEVRNRYKNAVKNGETVNNYTPQRQLETAELEQFINKTLNKMPARQSTIFKMHRFQGKKYSEIALELSLSVKTVEVEMTKALKILRKEISKL